MEKSLSLRRVGISQRILRSISMRRLILISRLYVSKSLSLSALLSRKEDLSKIKDTEDTSFIMIFD
ncbi:MAG: hypothetical protein DDT42_00005 [candidate division WS2 bacterium]|uniref:Uncharacterized protein n=1 Tax=Psychracetigena formicireducens TaxID=2986056 RepID=A0A9E2BEK5_PSYF1|nr:hypothetical protein [Candidatus Psychracetigena formicireducens]MBT9144173.1 hypothetical protein [Candidatus Psychracetigena formicireducens]